MAHATVTGPEVTGPRDRTGAVANGRSIRRSRPLPSGRALAGGILVAVSVVGLFAAWSGLTAGPRHVYVVAAHDVPVGSRLARSDLALATMDIPASLRARAFADPARLVGAVTLGPLAGGELLQSGAVVMRAPGPALEELSFPVERGRLPAGLRSGERVDVLATYGTGHDASTVFVARGVLVVAVQSGRGAVAGSNADVVTLSAEEATDIQAITHATRAGQVTLARADAGRPDEPTPGPYRTRDPGSTASSG